MQNHDDVVDAFVVIVVDVEIKRPDFAYKRPVA